LSEGAGEAGVSPECAKIYGIKICVGDFVRIYPRSVRMMSVQGVVREITSTAIVLENEENTISIRLSEIKAIQKPKPDTLQRSG
jgi:hypothetical protein